MRNRRRLQLLAISASLVLLGCFWPLDQTVRVTIEQPAYWHETALERNDVIFVPVKATSDGNVFATIREVGQENLLWSKSGEGRVAERVSITGPLLQTLASQGFVDLVVEAWGWRPGQDKEVWGVGTVHLRPVESPAAVATVHVLARPPEITGIFLLPGTPGELNFAVTAVSYSKRFIFRSKLVADRCGLPESELVEIDEVVDEPQRGVKVSFPLEVGDKAHVKGLVADGAFKGTGFEFWMEMTSQGPRPIAVIPWDLCAISPQEPEAWIEDWHLPPASAEGLSQDDGSRFAFDDNDAWNIVFAIIDLTILGGPLPP